MHAGSGKAADLWQPETEEDIYRGVGLAVHPARAARRQRRDRPCRRRATCRARRGPRYPRHPACPYRSLRWGGYAGGHGARRRAQRDTNILASQITRRSAHYAGGLSVEEIAKQHRDIDSLNKPLRQELSDLQGHRVRHPRRRLARLSGRCSGDVSTSSSPASMAASAWTRRSRPERIITRSCQSLHDHPRPHDRPAAAAPSRLRGRYRRNSQGLREKRCGGGDQRQSLASRPRLALASAARWSWAA